MGKKDKKDKKEIKKEEVEIVKDPNAKILLILDGDPTHDWCRLFSNFKLADGSSLRILQASWIEVSVTYFNSGGCTTTVAPIRDSYGEATRPNTTTIVPDFLLVRNQARGPTPTSDKRNMLYGFMVAGIPSINSLESIYACLERPVMMSELAKLSRKHGDKFPLIPFNYYSGYNGMVIPPKLPSIVKVGHAHAGMGKQKVDDTEQFRDLATIIALYNDYCTGEPFIEVEYGIRVQKIGNSYRVLKKMMTGSGWKSQFGGSHLSEVELTEQYKFWADECSKLFGGMEILAVDALHSVDGKDYIIELNDTAIGMLTEHWEAESTKLCGLVVERMNSLFELKSNAPVEVKEQEKGEEDKEKSKKKEKKSKKK